MNQKEIQELIKLVAKSKVTEVQIEEKDFKITVKYQPVKVEGEEKVIYVQPPVTPQVQAVADSTVAAPTPPPTPAVAPATAPQGGQNTPSNEESKYVTIKSPMIGTFYRAPSPDADVFVEVGSSIKKGETVCVIEAMKLFNEIEAEISGTIVKVLVDDSTPVEYDQPLFLVDSEQF